MSRSFKAVLIFVVALSSGFYGNALASTWYVDGSVDASDLGSSWATAFKTVQEGLDAATTGDEVWVAAYTYHPVSSSDRFTSIQLIEGVALYGGFDATEQALGERDWEVNETILSGDIGTLGVANDNSLHVVKGAVDAIIDGFIIEDGYAKLTPAESCDDSGPLIATTPENENNEILRIVTDIQCTAGGGLYNVHANTVVRNTVFRYNTAGKGGAVYNMVVSYYDFAGTITAADDPWFENVTFYENYAIGRGGAVNSDFLTIPTFVDTRFIKNHCDAKGGGVYNDMGAPSYFINCLFARNTAERAGGLANDGDSSSLFAFTTMVGNIADDLGGALYQGTYLPNERDGQQTSANEPHLYDSLVMGNSSGASPGSLSNWHDDAVIYDAESTVEEIDDQVNVGSFLADDYSTLNSSAGWDPGRDTSAILSTWTSQFASETKRTYNAFDYTAATSGTGSGVVYVDVDAAAGGNGSSWASAYDDLGTAIAATLSGQQIWVAEGSYFPTDDGDRAKAFEVRDGVAIYGGFAGSETAVGQRNYVNNPTILDGDIGVVATASDNSYHVVVAVIESAGPPPPTVPARAVTSNTGTIDGFIVRNGYADGDFYHGRGGGMLIYDGAAPTVDNNTFTDNYALEGGGIAIHNLCHPSLSNVLIDSNSAERGGGILIRVGSDPTLDGVDFTDNNATDRGGAMFIGYGSEPTISNCVVSGNSALGHGGGLYADDNSSQYVGTVPAFSDCTFTGNSTIGRGGAIYLYNHLTDATGNNLTITGNTAALGGGGVAVDENATWACTGCDISSNTASTGSADLDEEDPSSTEAILVIHNDLIDIDSGSSTIDFGTVDVSSSASYSISLWNRGSSTLSFSNANAIQISGTHASDFSVDAQPGSTVSAHRSESATLIFEPSASGARSATVTIASDSAESPSYTFELSGTGSSGGGNNPPTATNLAISGTLEVGQILTGIYTYDDTDGDGESGTTYKWYRADDVSGAGAAAISGATSSTYTLLIDDQDKYLAFGVTPSDGVDPGSEATSAYSGPIAAEDLGTDLCSGQTDPVFSSLTIANGETVYCNVTGIIVLDASVVCESGGKVTFIAASIEVNEGALSVESGCTLEMSLH